MRAIAIRCTAPRGARTTYPLLARCTGALQRESSCRDCAFPVTQSNVWGVEFVRCRALLHDRKFTHRRRHTYTHASPPLSSLRQSNAFFSLFPFRRFQLLDGIEYATDVFCTLAVPGGSVLAHAGFRRRSVYVHSPAGRSIGVGAHTLVHVRIHALCVHARPLADGPPLLLLSYPYLVFLLPLLFFRFLLRLSSRCCRVLACCCC